MAQSTTRNPLLTAGVNRLSRSAAFQKRGLFKKRQAKAQPKKEETPKVVARPQRYYPTEDAPKALPNRKTARPTKLRKSITPGTVLILLAGRFRGKRVVFLKQLTSGLLLVTGPFKFNGVPLRRVNQAYVIATSTHVDLTGVQLPEKLNDEYFKRTLKEKKTKSEAEFMQKDATQKKAIDGHRVSDQKEVDKLILAAIKKTPLLKAYLSARFSLTKGQIPHELKF